MTSFDIALRNRIDELMDEVRQNREKYLKAWIDETGIHPDDAVLVEKREMLTTRFWVERKTPDDNAFGPRIKELEAEVESLERKLRRYEAIEKIMKDLS